MRRVVNRLLVLLLGLAVIALAIVVIVEVVAKLVGADPVLNWPSAYAWAQRTTWSDTAVLTISVLLVVAGVALVVGQLWRSRVRHLPVHSPEPATTAAITRRGLARDVTAAVDVVDGVTPKRVTVGRKKITVRATAAASAELAALRDAVTASVRERAERIHLRRQPRLVVNISRRS